MPGWLRDVGGMVLLLGMWVTMLAWMEVLSAFAG